MNCAEMEQSGFNPSAGAHLNHTIRYYGIKDGRQPKKKLNFQTSVITDWLMRYGLQRSSRTTAIGITADVGRELVISDSFSP